MNTFLDFLIMGLAAYRISELIINDNGPWDIIVKFRKLFKIEHDEFGEAVSWNPKGISGMLMCNRCNSIWLGIALTIFYYVVPQPYIVALCLPFALSAIVILLFQRKEGY